MVNKLMDTPWRLPDSGDPVACYFIFLYIYKNYPIKRVLNDHNINPTTGIATNNAKPSNKSFLFSFVYFIIFFYLFYIFNYRKSK